MSADGTAVERRGTRGFWPMLAALGIVWAARASVGFNVNLALDPSQRLAYSSAIKVALWVAPAPGVSMHWPHRIWRDGFGPGVFGDAAPLRAVALVLGS